MKDLPSLPASFCVALYTADGRFYANTLCTQRNSVLLYIREEMKRAQHLRKYGNHYRIETASIGMPNDDDTYIEYGTWTIGEDAVTWYDEPKILPKV